MRIEREAEMFLWRGVEVRLTKFVRDECLAFKIDLHRPGYEKIVFYTHSEQPCKLAQLAMQSARHLLER
jgi:hypothetical protein